MVGRSTTRHWFVAVLAGACGLFACRSTSALVVEAANANVPPVGAADPGWNNFTITGTSRDYIYLGDGWALSASHVGPTPTQIANPSFSETLQFFNGSQ